MVRGGQVGSRQDLDWRGGRNPCLGRDGSSSGFIFRYKSNDPFLGWKGLLEQDRLIKANKVRIKGKNMLFRMYDLEKDFINVRGAEVLCTLEKHVVNGEESFAVSVEDEWLKTYGSEEEARIWYEGIKVCSKQNPGFWDDVSLSAFNRMKVMEKSLVKAYEDRKASILNEIFFTDNWWVPFFQDLPDDEEDGKACEIVGPVDGKCLFISDGVIEGSFEISPDGKYILIPDEDYEEADARSEADDRLYETMQEIWERNFHLQIILASVHFLEMPEYVKDALSMISNLSCGITYTMRTFMGEDYERMMLSSMSDLLTEGMED